MLQLEPNIPAEVLYDKRDDGLKPANAWKGYHVLLNPDFRCGGAGSTRLQGVLPASCHSLRPARKNMHGCCAGLDCCVFLRSCSWTASLARVCMGVGRTAVNCLRMMAAFAWLQPCTALRQLLLIVQQMAESTALHCVCCRLRCVPAGLKCSGSLSTGERHRHAPQAASTTQLLYLHLVNVTMHLLQHARLQDT